MFKNKLNYKLLNMLLFIGIIYLFYQTNGLWITVGNKVVKILFPFLIKDYFLVKKSFRVFRFLSIYSILEEISAGDTVRTYSLMEYI